MGTLSIWHWLIVLIVVVLIFGTKKLANIGTDLGKAVKGFKDGLNGVEEKSPVSPQPEQPEKNLTDDSAKNKTGP